MDAILWFVVSFLWIQEITTPLGSSPTAVKVALGKINALTAEPYVDKLSEVSQDYISILFGISFHSNDPHISNASTALAGWY